MNARRLKEAFVFRTPVHCDEEGKTVKVGYVKSIIFTLSESGKKKCEGEIQPFEVGRQSVTVSCRHIHFISEPKRKLADANADEHTQSVKNAFLNVEPVVVAVPNTGVVRGNIKAVVYWRTSKGNIQCSADVLDASCPGCIVRSRLKYVFTQEEYDKRKRPPERQLSNGQR